MTGAPDLAKKLGIKPGYVNGLVDAPLESAAMLRAQISAGVEYLDALDRTRCDVILFWPRQLPGLSERFQQLQYSIVPGDIIWAVVPKKQFARERGVDFTWEQLQAAGQQTDLVDNKVASVSAEEYGTRFVIRKELRGKYTGAIAP